MSDGGSSIVARLAAAHQAQNNCNNNSTQNHTTKSFISLSSTPSINSQPQIHTAKFPAASSSVNSSVAGINTSKPIVISNSNDIVSHRIVANTNPYVVENESKMLLLRDYVNIPPPPPYPGTVSSSNMVMTTSIAQAAPLHGHSTSNVSAGSNGRLIDIIFSTYRHTYIIINHI